MLIIWDHGTGWLDKANAVSRGISYDSESKNHINIPQLKTALSDIGHVDLLGFDACLMQMAEVAYEIRGSADYAAGSEETEPADGYAYDKFLAPLIAKPEISPVELGRALIESYARYYDEAGKASTQSLLKTSALSALPELVDKFTAAVMKSMPAASARTLMKKSLFYAIPQNADLSDLVRLLAENSKDPSVSAAGEDLRLYLESKVVLYNRTTNAHATGHSEDDGGFFNAKDYSRSAGLAVYVPGLSPYSSGNEFNPAYSKLAWGKDSGWSGFISWYFPPK
jgi:hypothetical protein